jgi:hypothetical protein
MLKKFRDRFGTTGTVISVIALIAALGGTAVAASGALTGKQKKEVEKIAKKYAGKPGAPGAAGTNGTDGKDGANGKDGAEGNPGPEGKNGTNGTNGKSPENIEEFNAGDPRCSHSGGVVYEAEGLVGSNSTVCNGEKGPAGAPWPVGNTLPSGATETGTWAFTGTTADTNGIHVSISFPIRLASPLDENHVHWVLEPDFSTFCKSNGTSPQPEPGNLCVYLTESVSETAFSGIFSSAEEGEKGALTMGAVLSFSAPTGAAAGGGSFAVKAP